MESFHAEALTIIYGTNMNSVWWAGKIK